MSAVPQMEIRLPSELVTLIDKKRRQDAKGYPDEHGRGPSRSDVIEWGSVAGAGAVTRLNQAPEGGITHEFGNPSYNIDPYKFNDHDWTGTGVKQSRQANATPVWRVADHLERHPGTVGDGAHTREIQRQDNDGSVMADVLVDGEWQTWRFTADELAAREGGKRMDLP